MLKSLLLIAFASTPLHAAPFDKGGVLGVGARAVAQGGAIVARSDDSASLWRNAAGLGADSERAFDLGVHYGDVLGSSAFDSAFDHRGWIAPLELSYGVGYRHVGFQAAAQEEEFALGVAFPFTEDRRLGLGLVFRSLQSRLGVAGIDARGYGIDLGLNYHPPVAGEALRFGLALRDAQSALDWSTGISANPVQLLQAGVAWQFDAQTSAEFDAELASDPATGASSGQGFKLGAERWWSWRRYGLKDLAALRLGYGQSSSLAPSALGGQFSFGLGLQYEGARLDYAMVQEVSLLGPTHRVSGSYAFGTRVKTDRTPTPTPSATPAAIVADLGPLSLTLTASPSLFNPVTPGSKLTLKLVAGGTISPVAKTRLEILPALGSAVFARDANGLASTWTWDGKEVGGAWPAPGAYDATAYALDSAGTTLASASGRFQLDLGGGNLRLLPEHDVFAPIVQSARQTASMAVAYQGADVRRWTLSIRRRGASRPVRVLSGPRLPTRLQWDGKDRQKRGVPDGAYDLELSVNTAAGQTLSAKTSLDVDTRRPKLNLDAAPELFEAKGDIGAVTFRTGVAGEAGIPARWDLALETLQGKTLKGFSGKGSPPEQVVWNGVDAQNQPVAGGALYYASFKVEMESGAIARYPRLALASKATEPTQPFRVPLQSLRFEEGDEVIALDDYKGLQEAAAAVKKYSTDYVVVVQGYAAAGESNRSGLSELELSFLRAKAVRDFLVDGEGLQAAKVRSTGLGVEAAGNTPQTAAEARAKARRVEVILYAQ